MYVLETILAMTPVQCGRVLPDANFRGLLCFLLNIHILDPLKSLWLLSPNSDHSCHFFLKLTCFNGLELESRGWAHLQPAGSIQTSSTGLLVGPRQSGKQPLGTERQMSKVALLTMKLRQRWEVKHREMMH